MASRIPQGRRTVTAERQELKPAALGQFVAENPNPVLRLALDGTVLYANDASLELLAGLKFGVGDPLPDFLEHLSGGALKDERPATIELESLGRCYSLAVTSIKGADHFYLYCHDITALKEAEAALIRQKDRAQKQASHDALTGLPNRTLLRQRFEQAVARCDSDDTKLVLAFVDLDYFKEINDTHGHGVGDQVLGAVAGGLRKAVRRTDTVARWGGDEMILLLPGVAEGGARSACENIKNRAQAQVSEEHGFAVTMSMGAAVYPDASRDFEQLLGLADGALLAVKRGARNAVVISSEFVDSKNSSPAAPGDPQALPGRRGLVDQVCKGGS